MTQKYQTRRNFVEAAQWSGVKADAAPIIDLAKELGGTAEFVFRSHVDARGKTVSSILVKFDSSVEFSLLKGSWIILTANGKVQGLKDSDFQDLYELAE